MLKEVFYVIQEYYTQCREETVGIESYARARSGQLD